MSKMNTIAQGTLEVIKFGKLYGCVLSKYGFSLKEVAP